jgi:glycosyltransferase EpsD
MKLHAPDSKHAQGPAIYKIDGVGVDLSRFYPRTSTEKERLRYELGYNVTNFIITNVAELNKNKNQIMLVRSLPEIKKYIPNIKVLFIGKDNYPQVRSLVRDLDIENIVDFLGYRNDVDKLTAISNVAFSASFREGLPVNIIEAMACAIPIVCSKNRGHNSLIQNNVSGFLFSVNNLEDMTRCIVTIYNSPELAERVGVGAFQNVKRFDLNNTMKEMINIYKKFIPYST